jgi:tetratricopeptide (TPR) repeat protein
MADGFSESQQRRMRMDLGSSGACRRDTCLQLGYSHTINGLIDEAIECFDVAIQLDPACAIAYLLRGNAYDGQFEALDDYTSAISLNPRLSTALAARGLYSAVLGPSDQAMSDLNEAIRLYRERDCMRPNTDETSYSDRLRYSYRLRARLDKDAASRCYIGRARLHEGNDDFTSALADYTEAIRLCPKDGWKYRLRALCYYVVSENYEARSDDDDAMANKLGSPLLHEIDQMLGNMLI